MRSARSPRLLKRLLRPPFVLAAALLLVGLILPAAIGATGTTKGANTASTATTAESCATTDLALNKTATSSSTESAAYPASNAVDGNTGTRWSSAFSDPQWLEVDLGSSQSICQVTLNWEAAYATSFQIQTSADGTNWTNIYSTTTGTGGTQTLSVTGTGRYLRMNATARATGYGYSLWEFGVYGPTSGGGTGTTCGTTNVALNKTATASSTESAAYPASDAVDGNTGTRWSSAFSDPQWLEVDLGSSQSICGVTLNWEAAYATSFQIQTSADGTNWTNIYSTTTGTGGTQNLTVTGTGRYLRMYGTARATPYGYSLWEFGVYGTGGGGGTGTSCGTTKPALNPTRPPAPPTRPGTRPPPRPPPRARPIPPRTPWTATPGPAGPARSPTPSGWKWTSARPSPSAASPSTGRRPTPPRSRSRPQPTEPTGPRSTPPPPAPAAPRTSP